ncbi:xanthine/CO dehydrogenase XdhC/CoxF family maturation factor [Paraburkholderia sp. GAS334]
MDSIDVAVLQHAVDWLGAGRRVVLVTVTRTWGSSPRPVGSMLAMRDDGVVSGSVSGGCVEDDLMDRARGNYSPAGGRRWRLTASARKKPCVSACRAEARWNWSSSRFGVTGRWLDSSISRRNSHRAR